MRRAGPALVSVTLLELMINSMLTMPARAGCAAELQALRATLASVSDPHRHEELQKLLDKAAKDDEAGRAELCGQAVPHAEALVKS